MSSKRESDFKDEGSSFPKRSRRCGGGVVPHSYTRSTLATHLKELVTLRKIPTVLLDIIAQYASLDSPDAMLVDIPSGRLHSGPSEERVRVCCLHLCPEDAEVDSVTWGSCSNVPNSLPLCEKDVRELSYPERAMCVMSGRLGESLFVRPEMLIENSVVILDSDVLAPQADSISSRQELLVRPAGFELHQQVVVFIFARQGAYEVVATDRATMRLFKEEMRHFHADGKPLEFASSDIFSVEHVHVWRTESVRGLPVEWWDHCLHLFSDSVHVHRPSVIRFKRPSNMRLIFLNSGGDMVAEDSTYSSEDDTNHPSS